MKPADRWKNGVEHNPLSVALYKAIERVDFEQNGDSFCFKSGGDGDNGETLMYLMDVVFESFPKDGLSTAEREELVQLRQDSRDWKQFLADNPSSIQHRLRQLKDEVAAKQRGYDDLHQMVPGSGDIWTKVDLLMKDLQTLQEQVLDWETAAQDVVEALTGKRQACTAKQLPAFVSALKAANDLNLREMDAMVVFLRALFDDAQKNNTLWVYNRLLSLFQSLEGT